MSSLEKMLSVLDLFSLDRSHITSATVQDALGLTRATAYRYLKTLTDAGLLARIEGAYVLGPRAIELDYLIRHSEPLTRAAEGILAAAAAAHDCDLQLIGLSGNHILVTSHARCEQGFAVSYGRGRTMPALKGAGSRVILAMLSPARQRALVAKAAGPAAAEPGSAQWKTLRSELVEIRRRGFAVSEGELDEGNIGIAVPISHAGLDTPAALVLIMSRGRFALTDLARIVALLHSTADRIVASIVATDYLELADQPSSSPGIGPSLDRPPIGLAADLKGATPEQRRIVDLIVSGPRGSIPSPFLAMLDAPPLAESIQQVGAVIRFSSTLPDDLREFAIMATAGAVDCGYEWNYHAPIAAKAGVPAAAIEATRPGASDEDLDQPYSAILLLCRALAANRRDAPDLLVGLVDALGRTKATEVVTIAGYYAMLANFIKTAGFNQPFNRL